MKLIRYQVVILVILAAFWSLQSNAESESGQSVHVTPAWISRNLVLPEGCSAQPQGLLSDSEVPRLHVYPLASDQNLLELTCEVYVYQVGMAYFIAPSGFVEEAKEQHPSEPLQPLTFQTATLGGKKKSALMDTSFLVGVPQFKPESGTLEMLRLGRGLGDCGQWFRWRYDEQAERFVLEQARSRNCTDSTVVFPLPEQWPLVYAEPSLSPQPKDFPWVTVGSLGQPLGDVGCALTHRDTEGHMPQIFKHSPSSGAWMNLNGQERQLKSLSGEPPSQVSAVYRWRTITIRIDYGKSVPREAGVDHPEATITLIQNGHEAVIPAKGGCGC